MYDLPYGYCGIMCALCNRHIVNGNSACSGCSQNGYYSESCKIAKCCKGKNILHCALCEEFPCAEVKKIGDFSDLNTNEHYTKVCHCISEKGFEVWYQEYEVRKALLMIALEKYNNGRMKRYLCELFMREDLIVLQEIMKAADKLTGTPKECSSQFKSLADNIVNSKINDTL